MQKCKKEQKTRYLFTQRFRFIIIKIDCVNNNRAFMSLKNQRSNKSLFTSEKLGNSQSRALSRRTFRKKF